METSKPRSKAVLIGVQLPKVSEAETSSSLQELHRLVTTLGFEVLGSISQKRPSLGGAVVLGEGKLRELARWTGGPGVVQPTVQVKKSKAAERFGQKPNEQPDEQMDEDDETPIESEDALPLDSEEPQEFEAKPTDGQANVVVFDCDLTPSQLRNLESATGVSVFGPGPV